MKYIKKDNSVIEYNITEEDKNNMFKINLPENEESYATNNGEGVWAYCSKKDYIHNNTASCIFIARILNDSIYYPGLNYGADILVEYKGGDLRPIAVLDELQHKYSFSLENKIDTIRKIIEYRSSKED